MNNEHEINRDEELNYLLLFFSSPKSLLFFISLDPKGHYFHRDEAKSNNKKVKKVKKIVLKHELGKGELNLFSVW